MPDSVPNYLTINPTTGAIGAQFTGHVSATGLDLTATRQGSPISDREIIWKRELDGTNVAQVWALEGDAPTLIAREIGINAGEDNVGGGTVHAGTNPGHTAGQVWIDAYKTGGPFSTRVLLNADGTSDFLPSARPVASAALSLINPPWSPFAPPWGPAFWRQQANGLVTFYGIVQSTGAFGLPLNICGGLPTPKDINGNAQNIVLGCYTSSNNIARVDIQANGVMLMNTGGAAPSGAGWWFNLNGISYYA